MNNETYTRIPDDLKAGAVIDETIPTGQVELRPSGVRLPVDEWVARRRAEHKRERQNKKAGRLARKKR